MWKSQIPSYYDWDRDGRMDSDLDKARFDTNNNNIADWHDAGYDTIDAWHADMTVNELVDFPFISQYGDTCWAADIGMVSWYFTGCATTDIAVAKKVLGNDDYNKAQLIPEILAHLRDGGFLNGSGYEVNENTFNHMGDDQETVAAFIKEQIDAGKPMILEMSEPGYEHVVVISGYDYSSSEEKKIKVYDSALSGQLTNNCSYSMTLDEITPIPNMSSHRIISFNRIG